MFSSAFSRQCEPRFVRKLHYDGYDARWNDIHYWRRWCKIDESVEQTWMDKVLVLLAHVPTFIFARNPGLDLNHRSHLHLRIKEKNISPVCVSR